MKKILHISNDYLFKNGNNEIDPMDILKSLSNDFENIIVCFVLNEASSVEQIDNIKIYKIGYKCKIFGYAFPKNFKKVLKNIINESKPDYIHFHYPNPFVAKRLLRILKNDDTIELIVNWHMDILKQRIIRGIFVNQNFKLLNIAKKVIASSNNYVDGSTYLTLYKNKLEVIPLYINSNRINITKEEIDESLEIKKQYQNKIICFFNSEYAKTKSIIDMVKVSKLLDDRFVILIGADEKYTKKAKELAKDNTNIVFLGNLDNSSYRKYMNLCDIFCFPVYNKIESYGLAVCEALFFSKAVVMYDVKSSSNYVNINNQTGIEINKHDITAFKETIEKLSDESLRIEYGNNGKKRIDEYFTYERFKNDVVEFYKKLEEENNDN